MFGVSIRPGRCAGRFPHGRERVCRLWGPAPRSRSERSCECARPPLPHTVKAAALHLDADREAAWMTPWSCRHPGLSAVAGSGALLAVLPNARWAVVTSCGRPLAERRLTAVDYLTQDPRDQRRSRTASRPPTATNSEPSASGRTPRRCVVFEDAPAGIAAARAAGARVIGLTTDARGGDLTGSDATIPDFTAIRVPSRSRWLLVTIR